jgi:DNA-binding response OmpR family regulator
MAARRRFASMRIEPVVPSTRPGAHVKQPRTVLFVSNHPDTAELYSFALKHAGFDCVCVETAQAAVALSRETIPGAIVLHLHPNEGPEEIGSALRQNAPGTALIGLFSVQLSSARLKQILRSFDDALLIPCTPDALVARVVRLMETRRRQESA